MLSALSDVLDKYSITKDGDLIVKEPLQLQVSEEYSFLNNFSFGSSDSPQQSENSEEEKVEEEQQNEIEGVEQIKMRTQQELSPIIQHSPRRIQNHESTPRFLKKHSINLLNLRRNSVITFDLNEISAYLNYKNTSNESPCNTERRFSVNYFQNEGNNHLENLRRGSLSQERLKSM